MLKIRQLDTGVVYGVVFNTTNGRGETVSVGLAPFSHSPNHSHTSFPSTLLQGYEDLHGENGVLHDSTSGDILLLPKKYFTNTSLADKKKYIGSPLYYLSSPTATPFFCGAKFIPHGGSLPLRFPRYNAKTGEVINIAEYLFTHIGYVMSYHSARCGKIGCYVDSTYTWFNKSYTGSYTYTNTTLYEGEKPGNLMSLLVSQSKDIMNTGGEPSTATYSRSTRSYSIELPKDKYLYGRSKYSRGPNRLRLPPLSLSDIDPGDTLHKALSSLDALSINSLSFASELRDFKSLLPPIRSLADLDNPKNWANVYLWFRFGASLSYRDTKTILKSIPRILKAAEQFSDKHRRVRASDTTGISYKGRDWKYTHSVKVILDQYDQNSHGVARAVASLRKLDLYPSLENLWDLVPYTFIIDWLIPVGKSLERLDLFIRTQEMTIHAVTTSDRFESSYPASSEHKNHIAFGEYTDVFYTRSVSPTARVFATYDKPVATSKGSIKRIVDGSSLILQRL